MNKHDSRDDADDENLGLSESQLWKVFKDNSDSPFFISVRGVVALPSPEDRRRISGSTPNFTTDSVPHAKVLNEYVGIIIAENKDKFDSDIISESCNNYKFNPTEQTARFVSIFLGSIRDLVCRDNKNSHSVVTMKIVKGVATAIAPAFAVATRDVTVGVASLLLLITLNGARHGFCGSTDMDVINSILDPDSTFERKSNGKWVRKPGTTPSRRPFYLIIIIFGSIIALSSYIAFKAKL